MSIELNREKITILNYGNPQAKPRMTRRDVWKKRPCVVKYRQWADRLREDVKVSLPTIPHKIMVKAFFDMPKSWSKKSKKEAIGKPHRQRPDADNILKAVCDILWKKDEVLNDCHIQKFWDDGGKARTEIYVW